MRAPFRDENATLVGRNAELEGDNARLRHALSLARAIAARRQTPVRLALAIAASAVVLSAFAALVAREPAIVTVTVSPPIPATAPATPVAPLPPSPRGPQNLPFVLATSEDPADWQKAREILEPSVFAEHATMPEVRLLQAICIAQGDETCADVCKGLLSSTQAPRGRAFELAASDDPADWKTARQLLEPKTFAKRLTGDEVRLLKAICKTQGDFACVDRCNERLALARKPLTVKALSAKVEHKVH